MDIKHVSDSIVFNENNLTKRVIYATKDILSFVLNMKHGQTLPVHKHENSSLVFIVLEGSGEVKINDEVEKITKGSVVYAKGEDDFSIPDITEDLSLFVSIAPNPSNHMYSKDL